MFGLFKKKQPLPSDLFLSLSESEYISKVRSLVDDLPPAGKIMLLVAYQNLDPLILAMKEMKKEDKSLPTSIEDLIRFMDPEGSKSDTEVGKRRKTWFWMAGLLKRIDKMKSEESKDIWNQLIESGAHIHTVLPPNQLWSEDEKAYFSHIKNEDDGRFYVSKILNPFKEKWS